MNPALRRIPGAVLTLRYLCLLLGVEVGLRTTRLPTLCRALGISLDLDSGRSTPGVFVLPRSLERRVGSVLRATRWWPLGDTCLRRCLLLGRVLRADDPVLRIGVRRDEQGTFAAHSWLELDGRSLDPMTEDFALMHSARRDVG